MQYTLDLSDELSSSQLTDALKQGHTVVMAIPMTHKTVIVLNEPEPEVVGALDSVIGMLTATYHATPMPDNVQQTFETLKRLHQRFSGWFCTFDIV